MKRFISGPGVAATDASTASLLIRRTELDVRIWKVPRRCRAVSCGATVGSPDSTAAGRVAGPSGTTGSGATSVAGPASAAFGTTPGGVLVGGAVVVGADDGGTTVGTGVTGAAVGAGAAVGLGAADDDGVGEVVADGPWRELILTGSDWVKNFLSIRLIGVDISYARELGLPEAFIKQNWRNI